MATIRERTSRGATVYQGARANKAGQVRIDGLTCWLDRLEKRAAR